MDEGIVSVGERPMTEAGVHIPRTALPSAYRRTVEDESYFVGELRKKTSELVKEIARLRKEIQTHQNDQGNYQSYEKRAETLSKEIKTAQNQLTDLNLMDDHINHNIEVSEVMLDVEELRAKNNKDEQDMDELFAARQKIEEAVRELGKTYEREVEAKENLVNDMSDEQSTNYRNMRSEIAQLSESISEQQQTLDELNNKVASFEEELHENPIKREAVKLHEQIAQMQNKKEQMTKSLEEEKLQSPEEKRKRLLEAVKSDNQEIAGMENKISSMNARIVEIDKELAYMEEANDDAAAERKKKYVQLLQREEEMNNYLQSYPANLEAETEKSDELEDGIVTLLQQISENMKFTGQLPEKSEVERDRKLLSLKQQELSRSEQTANTMQEKTKRLASDLNNVNNLEVKISSQLDSLKSKLEKWKIELITYDDISGLKQVTEAHKKRLQLDKKRLLMRRETTKRSMSDLANAYEKSRADLENNETYIQLKQLETKWQELEKQRHDIEDYIKRRETESNYKPYVAKVTNLIKEHNRNLKARPTTYVPSVAV